MLGLRERYEAHHKLRYTDEALMAAAKYSSQYISDRFLPDKVRGVGRDVGADSSDIAPVAGHVVIVRACPSSNSLDTVGMSGSVNRHR